MRNLKPNDRRAKNAISMIWAVLAMGLITTIFNLIDEIYMVDANYSTVDYRIMTAFYYGMSASGILYTMIYLVSAVIFIMWFRRAYNNLHEMRSGLTYTEGWAAGAWFVPIMNLYVPYRIMKELYTGTNTLLSQNLETCTTRLKTNYLVWWWALWLITGFFGQISFRAYWNGHADIGLPADIISTLLMIPLAVVTVIVIKDYAEIEPLLYETYQGDASDTEEGDHSQSFVE